MIWQVDRDLLVAHFHLTSAFTHLLLASELEQLPWYLYPLHFSSPPPPPPPQDAEETQEVELEERDRPPFGDATLRRRSK